MSFLLFFRLILYVCIFFVAEITSLYRLFNFRKDTFENYCNDLLKGNSRYDIKSNVNLSKCVPSGLNFPYQLVIIKEKCVRAICGKISPVAFFNEPLICLRSRTIFSSAPAPHRSKSTAVPYASLSL
jgi:hypothetical protein